MKRLRTIAQASESSSTMSMPAPSPVGLPYSPCPQAIVIVWGFTEILPAYTGTSTFLCDNTIRGSLSDKLQRRVSVEILVIMVGLILFDIAAMLWGVDSRPGVDSGEWQRNAAWPAI